MVPEKPKETMAEFIASLAIVLVTGLFIITFTLQAFTIPSSSIENTLLIGDHVFVDRMLLAPDTKWVGKLIPYVPLATATSLSSSSRSSRALRGETRYRPSR